MKAWLFSAWSSLRSSEKASQHSLNATIWPLQALKLWLVSQCNNMISQRRYCNAVMITMHYTLYIQCRHTVVPWPCCLRGQSEAFKWSPNTLEKSPHIFNFDISKTVVTKFYGFTYFPCSLAKWFFAGWIFTTLHVLCVPHLRKEIWNLPPSCLALSELYRKQISTSNKDIVLLWLLKYSDVTWNTEKRNQILQCTALRKTRKKYIDLYVLMLCIVN